MPRRALNGSGLRAISSEAYPKRGMRAVTQGDSTVLRSWEDRFGTRLLEVGFAGIRLLVSRPPQTLEAAQWIAAEHHVFSDDAHRACAEPAR
jgi:hypothetical protein